jgi:hypothetical protein
MAPGTTANTSALLKEQPTAVTPRTDAQPEHVLGCRIGKPQRAMRAVDVNRS